jgi:FHA domain
MSAAMVRIHYADGRAEDRGFPPGTYRIGRDAGDIVLHDPNVSGCHAELYVEPGRVGVADAGSSNGTFDMAGRPLSGAIALAPGQWVRFGSSAITLLALVAPNAWPPAPQLQAPAYPVDVRGASPAADEGDSHPDRPVRHTYPVAQTAFGFGGALQLLGKTMPYLAARLATLMLLSTVGLVYWVVAIAGFLFLGHKAVILGWAWLVVAAVAAGFVWRVVVRYFLYLLKMGHIAVLTDLITKGRVGNGNEGMFAYGKRIVVARFGEIAGLFGVHVLIDGVVGVFNRSLDWVSEIVPIPGLNSIVSLVKAVLRAATRYIAETVFSYNLARGDSNVFRSSKDGLVYYAQNSKEILKTSLLVVVLERVLWFAVFVVFFVPSLLVAYSLPTAWGGWLPVTAVVAGLLYAGNVRDAVLRPLFLTMVMLKFHKTIQGQPINAEWDQRLASISRGFQELGQKAVGLAGAAPAR